MRMRVKRRGKKKNYGQRCIQRKQKTNPIQGVIKGNQAYRLGASNVLMHHDSGSKNFRHIFTPSDQ